MKRKILLSIAILGFLFLSADIAMGYKIDGYLDDWGIDLSAAANKEYLDTHLPSGGLDIDTVTEDNADSRNGWQKVGPGWTYGGYKNGFYCNGNSFDVEAIYFDNDQYNAYIAIVQGLPITGGTALGNPWFLPGDIAIGLGNGYTYGIDVSTFNSATQKAEFYQVSSWNNVYYPQFSISNPWTISSGTLKGEIDFVYSAEQNTHYVMEAAIPLSKWGWSAAPGEPVHTLGINWTQQCGNDYLNLPANVNPVPEPNTLLLLSSGLLGVIGAGIRKRK